VWRYRACGTHADCGPLFEMMEIEDMIGRSLSMEAPGRMRHCLLAQDEVGLPRAWNGGTHACSGALTTVNHDDMNVMTYFSVASICQ